jgi:hypothetical protein
MNQTQVQKYSPNPPSTFRHGQTKKIEKQLIFLRKERGRRQLPQILMNFKFKKPYLSVHNSFKSILLSYYLPGTDIFPICLSTDFVVVREKQLFCMRYISPYQGALCI